MKTKELLKKKAFTRITAMENVARAVCSTDAIPSAPTDRPTFTVYSQGDFLREFFPSGHRINDPVYYPNRIKYDEKKDKFFEEKVIRTCFPFQRIITIKHLCHLCGNDIQFEQTINTDSETSDELFFEFKKGWLEKNMEVTWYEAAKSAKVTGDAAVVCYLQNGIFRTKVLSYLNGDVLYPHYDSSTGEMNYFAREYTDYDDKMKSTTQWVEVWDNTNLSLYKKSNAGISKVTNMLKEALGLDGYSLESATPHGFNIVPIAYYRDDEGPCWSNSQDAIDKYELAISQLCQNNMAYAFPIMFLKGDSIEIQGDIYGAVKAITMGQNDDGGFFSRPDGSASFELQLKILLQNIFMGSFAVLPPEVKAGDLPGVAVKLLYSPAVEQAMSDAQLYNPFIDKLVELFKYGYGIEMKKISEYKKLNIIGWIKPYIHQNETEIFTNMASGVQNGFVSAHSASETATDLGYGRNGEWDRIMKEKKEIQQMDLMTDLIQQQNRIKAAEKMDKSGGAVDNTGGRKTDQNGNYPGENNWDTIDQYT